MEVKEATVYDYGYIDGYNDALNVAIEFFTEHIHSNCVVKDFVINSLKKLKK